MMKNAPMGSIGFHLYNVLYLTVFTGVMAFGLLFVHYITYVPPNPLKDVENMLGEKADSYTIVQSNITKDEVSSLEEADRVLVESYFDTPEILRFLVSDKETGEPVMKVFSVSSGGFGGSVKALVGTDGSKITALDVFDVSTETAGLGQRIAEIGFQLQFIGKTREELPMDRTQWGNGMDMISGATFSSASIIGNLVQAFNLYNVGEK